MLKREITQAEMAAYREVGGDQVAILWLALDPVDLASGAVEYVKGSHRWGRRFLPETFSGTAVFTEDLPPLLDIAPGGPLDSELWPVVWTAPR